MFDIDPNLPRLVLGDKLRLQQVLINLAGNALKFTSQGNVTVGLKQISRSEDAIKISFSVTDTGIGIREDLLHRIFESFVQAETSTARRFGGTGLGLVISKKLVSLMGGDLNVESVLNQGSRFWFDIEFKIKNSQPLVVQKNSTPFRVLIADDNPVATDILVRHAQFFHWQVNQVNTGNELVATLEAKQIAGSVYDLVLIDGRLLNIDNSVLTQQIQTLCDNFKRNHLAPKIIVLVTTFDREILLNQINPDSHCINDFLTKPITPQQLVDSVEMVVSGQRNQMLMVESEKKYTERLKGLTILVVEDNALNRQVAFELLSAEGAVVDLAEGGLDGVAKVIDGQKKYQLIIMDMQMPDIDGLEATRRIRAQQQFKKLPIMAMTANASAADKENCLAAGMNEHVAKPIDMNEVVPKILHLIASFENQQQLNQEQSIQQQSIQQQSSEHDQLNAHYQPHAQGKSLLANILPTKDLIESYDAIINRFAQNESLYQNLLKRFPEEFEQLSSHLRNQIAERDLQKIIVSLHSMKGIAATLGAKNLSNNAAALEKQMKQAQATGGELIDNFSVEELRSLFTLSKNLLFRQAGLDKQTALDKSTELTSLTAGVSQETSPTINQELLPQIEELLLLLKQNNLKALDRFNQIYNNLAEDQQHQFTHLSSLVNNLNFSAAIHTIENLLKDRV